MNSTITKAEHYKALQNIGRVWVAQTSHQQKSFALLFKQQRIHILRHQIKRIHSVLFILIVQIVIQYAFSK